MTDDTNTENETISPTSVSLNLAGATVALNQDDDSSTSDCELSDDDDDNKKIKIPNSAIPSNTVVNVENSSDVIIGTVTQFHGPVTIYQNTHNNTSAQGDPPNFLTQISGDNVTTVTSSAAKLVATESLSGKRLSNFKELPRKKLILISFTIIILLISTSVGISMAIRKIYQNNAIETLPEPTTTPKYNLQNSKHRFIDRKRWGGRDSLDPKPKTLTLPVKYVIISHTGGHTCSTVPDCQRAMQIAQSEAVVRGYPDITYNFVIGGDGNIYVGRGWDIKNDHKVPVDTIDISFIGNFVYNTLNETMIEAAKKLLEYGVKNGKLDKDYKIYAHNQTENTVSPGPHIFAVIKTWPHYADDILTESSL